MGKGRRKGGREGRGRRTGVPTPMLCFHLFLFVFIIYCKTGSHSLGWPEIHDVAQGTFKLRPQPPWNLTFQSFTRWNSGAEHIALSRTSG